MKTTHAGDVEVCTDCYFAHHYGATEHDGEWFAGESDSPADREPLALLAGYDLADNTDSETGEGIADFSWSRCDGCGSTLGGSRYRLALFAQPIKCERCRKGPHDDGFPPIFTASEAIDLGWSRTATGLLDEECAGEVAANDLCREGLY